jgi:uncharacterized PurR-regulated membrane protein YhhQ (DUF165 family)
MNFWETVLAILLASILAALIDLFIFERIRRGLYD